MFPDEDGPAETAIDFTDRFVDAAIAKLDAVFGTDHAKQNPQVLAAYIATCGSNLNAFMTAAATMQDAALDAALEEYDQSLFAEPAPKPKRKRR